MVLGDATVRGHAPDNECTDVWDGIRGWSRLYGQIGKVNDPDGPAAFRYRFSGFRLGLDKEVIDGLRLGVTGDYTYTSVDFSQLNSATTGTGGSFGAYGVKTLGDAYF